MTGGAQLVEGAHLTGGDILCRESSKPFGFYDRGSEKTIPCRKLTWKTSLIGLLFFIVHTLDVESLNFIEHLKPINVLKNLGQTFVWQRARNT